MPSPLPSTWWRAEVHGGRRPLLLARNRIKTAFRRWFEAQDFVEVEAAALQVSPGNEAHLHAFGITEAPLEDHYRTILQRRHAGQSKATEVLEGQPLWRTLAEQPARMIVVGIVQFLCESEDGTAIWPAA